MELLFKITSSKIIFYLHQSQTCHAAAMGEANISHHAHPLLPLEHLSTVMKSFIYQDGHSSLCPWTWTVRSISGSSCLGRQQLARLYTSNQQDIIACLPTHACMYVVSRQPLFSASVLLLSAPVCLAHEINLHDVCAQEWFDTHFKAWCWAGPDQTLALKYIVVL